MVSVEFPSRTTSPLPRTISRTRVPFTNEPLVLSEIRVHQRPLAGDELAVVARDPLVGQHDLVVRRPPDASGAATILEPRGRPVAQRHGDHGRRALWSRHREGTAVASGAAGNAARSGRRRGSGRRKGPGRRGGRRLRGRRGRRKGPGRRGGRGPLRRRRPRSIVRLGGPERRGPWDLARDLGPLHRPSGRRADSRPVSPGEPRRPMATCGAR